MADVLFILGMGRSGSTALERLLASHAGTVAIGEARSIWTRGFDDERLCSCRAPIAECAFWQGVRKEMGGDPDPSTVEALTRNVDRMQYVPMMHHPVLRSPRFRRALPRSVAFVREFYESIAATAPDRLIIDSAKFPSFAHLLSVVPGVRAAFVHLVRDPRAVAYSYGRDRVRPDVTSTTSMLSKQSPATSAVMWDAKFVAALALTPYARGRMIGIRYEDFAAGPREVVARINGLLERNGMRSLGEASADADADWYHSIYGNPMRFEGGLSIRPDVEWHEAMPLRDKWLVGALTGPLLALHLLGIGF